MCSRMINLLVFSDSHGDLRRMQTAVARQLALPSAERPHYILFLGDGVRDFERLEAVDSLGASLLAVRGNCDALGVQSTPELRIPTFANVRAVMMHGHRFSVKEGLERAVNFSVSNQADLLLFGHTHRPFFERFEKGDRVGGVSLEKPLTLLNPGSIREGSFGVLQLSEKGIFGSHGTV